MGHAVIPCDEEEYGPFFSWVWRRHDGWRPLFFYGRGPADVGLMLGALLSLTGVWRFARRPRPLTSQGSGLAGQRVRATSTTLGSYGMGGPGFVGLRFDRTWVVVTLWAGVEWMTLDGRILAEGLFDAELPRHPEAIALDTLRGATLTAVRISGEQVTFVFTQDGRARSLSLRGDGTEVPPWRGTGTPKQLEPGESLADAIRVSRRARLWL